MSSRSLYLLLLAGVTFLVFWQTGSHDFINYDDPGYVYANPHVTGGFTTESLRWAVTSLDEENWHPLTWLSHMLDCRLFGLDPRGHHLMSLLLHTANTLLLFLLLARLTGACRKSAFVAALFALHPLHVESVAWIAERKDLLSALFFLLTVHAWRRYGARPALSRYAAVMILFALGLMAKPMLVTLPFVLLLLDWWPLDRFSRLPLRRLLAEKVPLLFLSAASSLVTLAAQKVTMATTANLPLPARVANAFVAYAAYLGKTFWPHPLIILYPLPETAPVGLAAAAAVLVTAITTAVLWQRRRRPFLAVGWLWFVGMLVPVIGLVQVGSQAIADRYTYLPLIGIFIILAWGIPDLVPRRRLLPVLALLALALCGTATFFQLRHWRDSITVLGHATRFASHPYLYNNLGAALVSRGRFAEGVASYEEALRIEPGYPYARRNLALAHLKWGDALAEEGNYAGALPLFRQALERAPDDPLFHYRFGVALVAAGRPDEGIAELKESLRLKPDDAARAALHDAERLRHAAK